MKQLHTINSDCVTILQHKIHYYLQIFDLNFSNARAEQNSCVFLSMKMNYHILSNEPQWLSE